MSPVQVTERSQGKKRTGNRAERVAERGEGEREGVAAGDRLPPSGMSRLEYIASLPDKEAEAYIFQTLQQWNAAMERLESAGGIPPVKTRTVPLPLEIVFRPDVHGTYNPRKATEDEDSIVYFEFEPDEDFGPYEPVEDPWQMRSDLLRTGGVVGADGAPLDPEGIVEAIWNGDGPDYMGPTLDGATLAYGRFGVGREDISVPSDKLGSRFGVSHAMKLLNREFFEWQSLIRAAMATKMSAWPTLKEKFPAHKVDLLCQPMQLAVEWQGGRPMGIIRCSGILQALIATVQVDAVINAEYRFCACVGCHESFKVKRKDQRYCDDRCKHKQVVRDGRERQSKGLKQTKARSGKVK